MNELYAGQQGLTSREEFQSAFPIMLDEAMFYSLQHCRIQRVGLDLV